MNIVEWLRTGITLGCLAAAFALYWGGKEGAGWFIFFAVITACSGDDK